MHIPHIKPVVRALILVLAALLFVVNALTLSTWKQQTDPTTIGTLGWTFAPGIVDKHLLITSLEPDGALARAGAKVGDRVEFVHKGTRLRTLALTESVELTLHTESGARRMQVRPQPEPGAGSASVFSGVINLVNTYLAIALAVAICVRRGREGAMLAFAMTMLLNSPTNFTWLLPASALQDFSAIAFRPLDYVGGYLCFLLFVLKFPAENRFFRRPLWRFLFGCYAAIFAVCAALWMNALNGAVHVAPTLFAWVRTVSQSLAVGTALLSVAMLSYSWHTSRGALRSRVSWILVSIGMIYVMWAAINFIRLVGWNVPQAQVDYVVSIASLFSLIGFSYALLRHQIFDFSFAVNRTLVFTLTSLMLFAAFWMIEQLVHKLVHFEAADKNAMLGGAIAFGLFFTFNRLHHRVDHWIENLFFRHWRAREAALEQFVAKAGHFMEIDALLAGFGSALDHFTGNAGNAAYLADADGAFRLAHTTVSSFPLSLSVDDDIAVTLRSLRRSTVVDESHPRLASASAFPMQHGDEMKGIYIVCARPDGQAYRPDQQAMLELSIARIGLELSRLQAKALERKLQRLEQEQERWQQELYAVTQDRATLRLALSKIPSVN